MRRLLSTVAAGIVVGVAGQARLAQALPVPVAEYRFNSQASNVTPVSPGTQAAANATPPNLTMFAADGTTQANRIGGTGPSGLGGDAVLQKAALVGDKSVAKFAGDIPQLDNVVSVTVAFWVNGAKVSAGNDRVYVYGANDGNAVGGIETELSPVVDVKYGTSDSTLNMPTPADNTWQFIAITYDGSAGAGATNNLKVYQGTTTTFTNTPGNNTVTLGALGNPAIQQLLVSNRGDGSRPLGYALDDLTFFASKTDGTAALSFADLQTVYTNGLNNVSSAPEPTAIGLLGVAVTALLARRRRSA